MLLLKFIFFHLCGYICISGNSKLAKGIKNNNTLEGGKVSMRKYIVLIVIMVTLGTVIAASDGVGWAETTSNRSLNKANAVVDNDYSGADGSERNSVKIYKTIQSALDGAPIQNKRYVILIKNGRYYEKITVNKPFITFIGESRDKTKLTYDAAADTKGPDGKAYTTYGSATLTVAAGNFTLKNMTVENGFDYPANDAKPVNDPTRLANEQAVAIKTDVNSEKAVFENCNITGYQDTLFANVGTQYYHNCYISGNVDFIFGAGQAVFDDCDIVSRDRKSTNNGYITAASTQLSQEYGFLFVNCRLEKDGSRMADESVALGRPWHPTTNLPDGTRQADPNAVGCVVFKNCNMDAHIAKTGWAAMSGKDQYGQKKWFYPQNLKDARFFEYGSTGPGKGPASETRKILSKQDVQKYTIENVLAGWNPTLS
jgi:pectinesterase